jgi:hypothetical protein
LARKDSEPDGDCLNRGTPAGVSFFIVFLLFSLSQYAGLQLFVGYALSPPGSDPRGVQLVFYGMKGGLNRAMLCSLRAKQCSRFC